jgi:hypothetical protein
MTRVMIQRRAFQRCTLLLTRTNIHHGMFARNNEICEREEWNFIIESAECLMRGRDEKRVEQDSERTSFFRIRIYELHFGSASTGWLKRER